MTSSVLAPPERDVAAAAAQVGADAILDTVTATANAAMDVVADTRILTAVGDHGTVRLLAATPDGPMPLLVQPGAHRQLAEKVGIPWSYYERMLAGQPDLLATNLNRWFAVEPNRHMLRMVRPISEAQHRLAADTQSAAFVRAVVSSRYRTLDHAQMLSILLPEAAERGLTLADANLTDTRLALRFVGPERSLDEIATAHQMAGTVLRRGEIMSHGVFIRNSETGHASYAIEPFARILACLNGMIVAQTFRAVHVGRDKEDGVVSEQTQRLEDAAVFARSRDRFLEVTDESRLLATGQVILSGMNTPLFAADPLPMFEVAKRVSVSLRLTTAEQEVLQEALVQDVMLNTTPTVTRFNVSQAVTATARIGFDATGDDERRTELERLGWQVLEDPVERLLKAGEGK